MVKKIQSYLNIVLILFVIFAIIYFLFSWIRGLITKPDVYTKESIKTYIKSDNIVTSHSLFETLDNCSQDFIEACINRKYEDLHNIVIEKYKKIYTTEKLQNIVENYNKKYFTVNRDNEDYYVTDGNLINAYSMDEYYLLEIKTASEKLYLIVEFDMYSSTYSFVVVED